MTRRAKITALARRVRREQGGLAAIELGLMAPFLALLLLGGFDVARYVLTVNKVMKIGFSVSDVTSQYSADTLNNAALQQIFQITSQGLSSYVSGTTGVTILTSIYEDSSGVAKVRWQCFSSSGSGWSSKIGVAGSKAAVDQSLLLDVNDNVIISEVYYKFKPVFSTYFKAGFDIYSKALFRPRLGSLATKPCS